ncbi:MAG TPA: nucleotidyltransferase domain-containing protein [Rubricoccaceae bacterium]|nr:nucleotidyltransferase domain-containing protein [Rubricoccaceae bacterium]
MTHPPEIQLLLDGLRRRLNGLYGDRLVRLVLYGSHARGDARPGSDVDVALVLRGPVDAADEIDRTAAVVADVVLDHGHFVSVYPISEEDYEAASRAIIRAVRAEGVPA